MHEDSDIFNTTSLIGANQQQKQAHFKNEEDKMSKTFEKTSVKIGWAKLHSKSDNNLSNC